MLKINSIEHNGEDVTITLFSTGKKETEFFKNLLAKNRGLKLSNYNSLGVTFKTCTGDTTPHNKPVAERFLDTFRKEIKKQRISFRIDFVHKKVVAINDLTGLTSIAKCSPNDTFDVDVGMAIALARALAKNDERRARFNLLPIAWKW